MLYLAGEIFFCLLISLLIGFTCGWALRGIRQNRKLKNLEKLYRINMASLQMKKKAEPHPE